MRIARINTDDGPKTVVVHGESFLDYYEIAGVDPGESPRTFFSAVSRSSGKVAAFLREGKLSEITDYVPSSYLVPIPMVNQIRDFYAFEDHVRAARARRGLEMVHEWYEFPAYYYSRNSNIFPSDEPITYPEFSSELDYELEVAAVIGKEGKDIPKYDAWQYIFGFMLANDWSARDIQRKEMKIGLGPAKSKDFATSFGRFLVTADEMASRLDSERKLDCDLKAYVNDNEYASSNLNRMHWTFQEMISWASTGTSLKPGDIIMSGTAGGGCILEIGPEKNGWLKKGDVVRFHSSVLGELVSGIV